MSATQDPILKHIEDRRAELREELKGLDTAYDALARLNGGSPSASAPPAPAAPAKDASGESAPRRRAGRPPGSGRSKGTRAEQALKLVQDKPGITIPDIASAMKIEPNYLYRVMPRLLSEGKVRQENHGWHPVG